MDKNIWKLLEEIGDDFEPVDKETSVAVLPMPDGMSSKEDIAIHLLENYYDERGIAVGEIAVEEDYGTYTGLGTVLRVTFQSGNSHTLMVFSDAEADEEAYELTYSYYNNLSDEDIDDRGVIIAQYDRDEIYLGEFNGEKYYAYRRE